MPVLYQQSGCALNVKRILKVEDAKYLQPLQKKLSASLFIQPANLQHKDCLLQSSVKNLVLTDNETLSLSMRQLTVFTRCQISHKFTHVSSRLAVLVYCRLPHDSLFSHEIIAIDGENLQHQNPSVVLQFILNKFARNCAVQITACPVAEFIELSQLVPEQQTEHSSISEENCFELYRVQDLSSLQQLNEQSILCTLKQRYIANLIHTYAGKRTLVIINPMFSLSIYSNEVMELFRCFKSRDLPPHVFAVAQSAYQALKSTMCDQSIVLLGYSGSGKTTNVHHILNYIWHINASLHYHSFADNAVDAVFVLLEAFCSCRTILNSSATRCAQTFTVYFNHYTYDLTGFIIKVLLVDQMRFVDRPEAESTFNVFYQFLAGLDCECRKQLFLENLNEPNLLLAPSNNPVFQQQAEDLWAKLLHAMFTLNFTTGEISAICSTLASIYHLGVAGFRKVSHCGYYEFNRHVAANRAASLLGVNIDTLTATVFISNTSTGLDQLNGFVRSLYNELLHHIVYRVNRFFSDLFKNDFTAACSICVVDIPGFQNPASCGRLNDATFTDLSFNYLQERLQELYYDDVINDVNKLAFEENIECNLPVHNYSSSASAVHDIASVIDDEQAKVSVMEDHSMCGQLTAKQWTSALTQLFTKNPQYGCLMHSVTDTVFELGHLDGTHCVKYNASRWLKTTQPNKTLDHLHNLLKNSLRSEIKQWFTSSIQNVPKCENEYEKEEYSLYMKLRNSVSLLVKTLKQTQLHFIQCLLPHSTSAVNITDHQCLNIQLLTAQLQASHVLDAALLYKLGFPTSMLFKDFVQLFKILVPSDQRNTIRTENRQAAKHLLECLNIDSSNYKLGLTKIFCRSTTLSSLLADRDLKITDWIILLQSMLRGALTRRRLLLLQQAQKEQPWMQTLQKERKDIAKKFENLLQQSKQDLDTIQLLKEKLHRANILINDVQVSCEQHQLTRDSASRMTKSVLAELDDLKTVNAAAVRAKKCLESEMEDLLAQLNFSRDAQHKAEERGQLLAADNAKLQSVISSREDEIADLMKKYKALIQQNEIDLTTIQQQSVTIQDLHSRLQKQKSEVDALQVRLQYLQNNCVPKQLVVHLEAQNRELNNRLEHETASTHHAQLLGERTKLHLDRYLFQQHKATNELKQSQMEILELRKHVDQLGHQLKIAESINVDTELHNQQLERKLCTMDVQRIQLSEDLELSKRRIQDFEKVLQDTSSARDDTDISDSSECIVDNIDYMAAAAARKFSESSSSSLDDGENCEH